MPLLALCLDPRELTTVHLKSGYPDVLSPPLTVNYIFYTPFTCQSDMVYLILKHPHEKYEKCHVSTGRPKLMGLPTIGGWMGK